MSIIESNGKEIGETNGMFAISHPKQEQVGDMTRSNSQRKVHMSLTRLPSAARSDVSVDRKSLPKLTRGEIFTIVTICCGNFCLGTLYAILAPFFPHEVISPITQFTASPPLVCSHLSLI